jgi:hypothetical protein
MKGALLTGQICAHTGMSWRGGGATRNETGEAGVKSSPKPDVRTSSKSTLVQATTDLHNMG